MSEIELCYLVYFLSNKCRQIKFEIKQSLLDLFLLANTHATKSQTKKIKQQLKIFCIKK